MAVIIVKLSGLSEVQSIHYTASPLSIPLLDRRCRD